MTSFDDNKTPVVAETNEESQPTTEAAEPPKSTSLEKQQEQPPPPPAASTSTPSAEDDGSSKNDDDAGGVWGLASAFGGSSGWGLGSDAVGDSTTDDTDGANQTGATDAELKELESSIAAAETAVSTAIWSTFGAVTSAVSGVVGGDADAAATDSKNTEDPNAPLSDADLDAFLDESPKEDQNDSNNETKQEKAALVNSDTTESNAPAPAVSSSIWSSLGAVVSESLVGSSTATTVSSSTTSHDAAVAEEGGGNDESDSHPIVASASSALYNLYTSNVNRAAEWIEDLERANADNDPYKRLKEHLNTYLEAHPRGNYEEWVQIFMSEHGWDASGDDHKNQSNGKSPPTVVVVDPSYYTEDCPHRILWNERNYQDGIQIGDENPQRAYVPTPSTKDDRRHKPPVAPSEDEEVITFDGTGEAKEDGLPSTPPKQQQRPLFTDDESLVVVKKPSPVLSCSTIDTRSDDGSGIVVSKVTSTTEVPILEDS